VSLASSKVPIEVSEEVAQYFAFEKMTLPELRGCCAALQDILKYSDVEPAKRMRLLGTISILRGDLNLDFMNEPLEGDDARPPKN